MVWSFWHYLWWKPRLKKNQQGAGMIFTIVGWNNTRPETNSIKAPENRPKPNRKVVFQPSIFRGELLVLGSVSFPRHPGPPKLGFGMTGPQKHTDQTPNLRRYDWMSRVLKATPTPNFKISLTSKTLASAFQAPTFLVLPLPTPNKHVFLILGKCCF